MATSVSEIRDLYAYNEWANDRMFTAIRKLSEEQFTRELTSSYPTVRDTLGHIVVAEWLWLQRWKGSSPTSAPQWLAGASLGLLEKEMKALMADRRTFLSTLDDDALNGPISYTTLDGTPHTNRLLGVLQHVVNHSSYHRGQLTTMLRQVGAVPPSTDLIVYLRLAERAP